MGRAVDDGRVAPRKRRFRHRALTALGIAATLLAPTAARPASPLIDQAAFEQRRATPALWEVRDGDTTIYLFGTFHTLDERTTWFDRSVRAAFDRSGELVLETIAPTDPAELRAIGRSIAGPRPKTNSFLGATRTAVEQGRASGLSVDRGADSVLRRAAADQGKSLSGIELFTDQLRTFARIAAAPPAPVPAAATSATAPVTLATLLAAWKAGDTGAFTNMLAGFESKAPAAYRMLIADRNVLYGEWIAQRLDQPGTVFVAVGSGHLAGKDSVQNWLSARGIEARRIA
jgi:uncharacterized protein YbaP (TraB family)